MDRAIRALVAEGFSDRQIAREVGLSRTAVRKRRAKFPAPVTVYDDDDDLTEADLERMDADDDDYPYPPPWRFCGVELVSLPRGRGEGPKVVESERWIDGKGRPVDALCIYRWSAYRQAEADPSNLVEWDAVGAEIAAVEADMDRQRREYAARWRARRP